MCRTGITTADLEYEKMLDELETFDYDTYKANGFRLEHLGDYPLMLETKPD